jgi:hypothetical protein
MGSLPQTHLNCAPAGGTMGSLPQIHLNCAPAGGTSGVLPQTHLNCAPAGGTSGVPAANPPELYACRWNVWGPPSIDNPAYPCLSVVWLYLVPTKGLMEHSLVSFTTPVSLLHNLPLIYKLSFWQGLAMKANFVGSRVNLIFAHTIVTEVCYKLEGRVFDSRRSHWINFPVCLNLAAAL